MNRFIALSFVFAAVAGFLTLLADEGRATSADEGRATSAEEKKFYEKPYEMVADLDTVMGYIDEIFTEVPEQVKANRTRKIRTSAMFLAELTNVSAHSKDWRAEKGWGELMMSMKKDFMDMSEAAKAKDKDKISALHKKITGTCDKCHDEIRDA